MRLTLQKADKVSYRSMFAFLQYMACDVQRICMLGGHLHHVYTSTAVHMHAASSSG